MGAIPVGKLLQRPSSLQGPGYMLTLTDMMNLGTPFLGRWLPHKSELFHLLTRPFRQCLLLLVAVQGMWMI